MTQQKWSKGTWEVRPEGDHLSVWAGNGIRFKVAEVSINRSIEAAGEPSAEEAANARLTAAAPVLFLALAEMTKMLDGCRRQLGMYAADSERKVVHAHAALKIASGETLSDVERDNLPRT